MSHDVATTRPGAASSPGTGSTRPPSPAAGTELRPLGLFTLLLGAALPMIDFFVVNVAFPGIESDLDASPAALEMVVASYAVAYAALLVPGGRLGDTYGRRKLFLWGVAAFGLTSLACGSAPGVWWLVGARLAQGAASALLFPQVLATIHATTQGRSRARAIGLFGSVGGISMVTGQVLGGVLVAADLAGTGWRMIFLINVPVVVVALALGLRTVPDSRSASPARGDVAGAVLLACGLTALLLPLTEGRAAGWPWWSLLLLAAACVLAWAFLTVERREERAGRSPLLPPSLLREPGVRRGLLAGAPIFLGFSSFMFESALVWQHGLRFGALTAGLTLVPMGLAQFAASMSAPRVTERLGTGRVLALSAVVQTAGLGTLLLALLAAWPGLSPLALAPGLLLCGLGQGLQLPTYYRVLLSGVPAARASAGSGLAATAQQSGLALGVATLGSLFLALTPHLGMREAFAAVLAVQACGLLLLAVIGLRMPRPAD
ncbi:MFS transporter [Streptomyces albus subsp. chlorinus]|uniref:MFS transporter n=1 Tax=Streptomyces albus TaxID=1888 RepID=UPI001570A03C|nr:MFS transporter [Streptomyces albus]NSC21631.1 MFS transporter [Streptomyces albus subsp. chlorinus]